MEVDNLINYDTESQALSEIKKIRNEVIGSDWLKEKNINIISKIVEYLWKKDCLAELKVECAVVLASLSLGKNVIIEELINIKAHDALIHCLKDDNLKLVEAGLRGLASIIPYLNNDSVLFKDKNLASSILSYLNYSHNMEEYVVSILIHLTNFSIYDEILFKEDTIQKIFPLLQTNIPRVQIQALQYFIKISSQNFEAAKYIVDAANDKGKLLDILSVLQNKNKKPCIQLSSAHCVVNLYRNKALQSTDHLVYQRTLNTLVCCCMTDKDWKMREEAAVILSRLIEGDLHLQRIAAISNQILKIMEEYLLYQDLQIYTLDEGKSSIAIDLKNAAFSVLAAISSNTEDFRKKIKDSECICAALLKCLENGVNDVALGALRLILPLSRSVYILRTWFREKLIHQYVIEAFMSAEETEVVIVTSSIICNMLIDFSPFIQAILEEKESVNEGGEMSEHRSAAILKILRLTRSINPHIQLNAITCLMNVTFTDDVALKKDLLEYLKHDDLFHLIRSSQPNNSVINNALATLRNFLSPLQMVDYVGEIHGLTIIESVILILEGDYPINVKEQALCILVNLSAGTQAQKLIMDNNDVLRKMISYLMHNSIELQLASNECIYNLVNKQNSGFSKRQAILRDMQCFKVLQDLHSTCTSVLKERIKATLQEI